MIKLAPEMFFVIFLSVAIILVIGLWIYEVWSSSVNRLNVSEENLVRCQSCSLIYVAERYETVKRCPRCETLNSVRQKAKV